MIKQKAPKDMTATELVNHLIDRLRELGIEAFSESGLLYELNRPAPNPFTPEEIEYMKFLQSQLGYSYAAMLGEGVFFFDGHPLKLRTDKWKEYAMGRSYSLKCFLRRVLPKDGSDCICLADYAPLEEKTNE